MLVAIIVMSCGRLIEQVRGGTHDMRKRHKDGICLHFNVNTGARRCVGTPFSAGNWLSLDWIQFLKEEGALL